MNNPINLEIDGILVQVTKKRIKNVILRVYPPDGLVKLSVPFSYKDSLIEQFLQDKSTWIKQQLAKIKATAVAVNNESLETGSTLSFLGKNYLLIVTEQNKQMGIKIADQLIHLYVPVDFTHEEKKNLLDRWYKQEMSNLLPKLIKHWEGIIPVKVAQCTIRSMKTRWGSCNTQSANISLNFNLVKKPIECLEYVLVHELVHLLEASHNHRFYALMDKYMPQWRQCYFLLEGKMPSK